MNAGRENTIHSLNTAAKRGADYVEFDVQLSKDKVRFAYLGRVSWYLTNFCYKIQEFT